MLRAVILIFPFRSNIEKQEEVDRSQSIKPVKKSDLKASFVAEDYSTQVSEQTEKRVTEKFSQEFSITKSRILGA